MKICKEGGLSKNQKGVDRSCPVVCSRGGEDLRSPRRKGGGRIPCEGGKGNWLERGGGADGLIPA